MRACSRQNILAALEQRCQRFTNYTMLIVKMLTSFVFLVSSSHAHSSSHTTIRKTMGVQDSHPSAVRQGYLSESCFLSSKSWHLASNIWKPQAQWPVSSFHYYFCDSAWHWPITTADARTGQWSCHYPIQDPIDFHGKPKLAKASRIAAATMTIMRIFGVGLYKLASGYPVRISFRCGHPTPSHPLSGGESLRIWWTFEWQEWIRC